jgi:hypothetical protein
MRGIVIGQDHVGILHVPENAHDLKEIDVPLIDEHFREVMETATDVAHVDGDDLVAFAEILNDRQQFGIRVLQSLTGCSEAEVERVIRTYRDDA